MSAQTRAWPCPCLAHCQPALPYRPSLCVQGIVLCFGNLFAPRRITSSVFLYALLTILFTVAGLAYLLLPK